ncbi:MAG: phosphomannomutase/phosphoglucomutase [Actinomycetales bacterium]
MELVDRLIKAYDIRGLVGSELTPEFAFTTGVAFASFLEMKKEPATVIVGEDMRPSSPELATAFSAGLISQSFDVIRIGLAATDQLYFASGSRNLPGAMFTASHNPAEYNGVKLCLSGARPIGEDSGLAWIRETIRSGAPLAIRNSGKVTEENMLQAYVDFLISLFPEGTFQKDFQDRQLKIAVDAGNGMGGCTAPAVMAKLNAQVFPIYFELDGTFPNHEANPIDPKNLRDLQTLVRKKSADIGLAFDGDADRCFLVDEKGDVVSPSALTALIAVRELKRYPGATIIHNLICSKSVPEAIIKNGGTPLRSRVGHSFIKGQMADSGAVFGGEHSGHFYFKDFWRADSGMLAALHAIAALLESGTSLSKLLEPFGKYSLSGEINTKVGDQQKCIELVRENFSNRKEPIKFDELDGLTVMAERWWLNLRPSNTEPLLRLNVEAESERAMQGLVAEVLDILKNQ